MSEVTWKCACGMMNTGEKCIACDIAFEAAEQSRCSCGLRWWPPSRECPQCRVAALDAQAAAMREALENVQKWVCGELEEGYRCKQCDPGDHETPPYVCPICCARDEWIPKALASDAGRPTLAELERLRAIVAKLLPIATEDATEYRRSLPLDATRSDGAVRELERREAIVREAAEAAKEKK